jgi:hypothetical protein
MQAAAALPSAAWRLAARRSRCRMILRAQTARGMGRREAKGCKVEGPASGTSKPSNF